MNVQPFAHSRVDCLSRPLSRLAGTRLGDCHLLSASEQGALEAAVTAPRTFRPNTDLVREGAREDSVFILLDGWACRYETTREGGRQLPALLLPGDVANLDSLMIERVDYGVRSLTHVIVVGLRRDRALALAAEYPGIARAFTWLALIENVILSKWILSVGRRSAKDRLAHLLCELHVRLGAGHDGENSFPFPITQEQLADALGLTSVHVNRTMQQLRGEGLIATANRTMTLTDVAALRRMCGFDPRYLHAPAAGQASPA